MTKAHSDGRRDLALIRASGSTARVLNLAFVFERFGHTADFAARPLFRNRKLNRALILKHALRDYERSLFTRPEPHTTKIVFPYAAAELGLGGTSVMVGERRFEQQFRQAIGASASEDDVDADFELVNLLHDLPSFDPFLLREQLKRAGREPAKCFFEISDADVAGMLAFVSAEIEPLTSLAFAASGRRAENLSMRLAEKLMTDENAQLLAPLRQTLRLSLPDYSEGVFAWKGFLYYKWMLRDFAARHAGFAVQFANFDVIGGDRRARVEIDQLRRDVLRRIDLVVERASALLGDYASAFAALAHGEPARFREFLLDAPAKFTPLGEAIGAVKHMHSFWGFRFPDTKAPRMESEEARELVEEFDRMLGGVALVAGMPADELMLA